MKESEIDEIVFHRNVHHALKTVKRILDVNRGPRLAECVEHNYEDKFEMVEMLTNTNIIAMCNVLQRFGLTAEVLKSIDTSKVTTLRFQASDTAEFLNTEIVEVDTGKTIEKTQTTTTSMGAIFGGTTEKTTIHKVIKKIKEHRWKVTVSWSFSLYSRSEVDKPTVLQSRTKSIMIVTQAKHPDLVACTQHAPIDLSLTWLLQMIDTDAMAAQFKIQRHHANTKTPRRNDQVEAALGWFQNVSWWTDQYVEHMQGRVENLIDLHNPVNRRPQHRTKLRTIDAKQLFCPVQPLMEQIKDSVTNPTTTTSTNSAVSSSTLSFPRSSRPTSGDGTSSSSLLSNTDMKKLLNEQVRTIDEAASRLQSSSQFPAKQLARLISDLEATNVMLCKHMHDLKQQHRLSVEYVEQMLRNQLTSAIGKTLQPRDVEQFMTHHNARLMNRPPAVFCHSIRRPMFSPDGIVSIERSYQDDKNEEEYEAIQTICRTMKTATPFRLPVDASTTIDLTGDVHLHGWLEHSFDNVTASLRLTARARQFSAFVLIVGNLASPNKLHPKDAIIVQNKDEVLIPLLLQPLPTSKEFKDSIRSLSPEQQRFAKSYRAMQLESSVLGIAVVQIKPQLERLLKLPDRALTKEMKLTNDLMELFVEHQVPSDMLCYDGPSDATMEAKLAKVREYTDSVMDVVQTEKIRQLHEEAREAQMAKEKALQEERRNRELRETYEEGDYSSESEDCDMSIGGSSMDMFAADECCALPPVPGGAGGGGGGDGDDFLLDRLEEPLKEQTEDFDGIDEDGMVDDQDRQDSDAAGAANDVGDEKSGKDVNNATPSMTKTMDFTTIPKLLDAATEKYNGASDNALRPIILKTSNEWTRHRQPNLLTKATASKLTTAEIQSERNQAMDLLDALSRSGSLAIPSSELHVVVCMGYSFCNDVMGTVIQDNVNPIEKLERSALMIGSVIHDVTPRKLVFTHALARLEAQFPKLLSMGMSETDI